MAIKAADIPALLITLFNCVFPPSLSAARVSARSATFYNEADRAFCARSCLENLLINGDGLSRARARALVIPSFRFFPLREYTASTSASTDGTKDYTLALLMLLRRQVADKKLIKRPSAGASASANITRHWFRRDDDATTRDEKTSLSPVPLRAA